MLKLLIFKSQVSKNKPNI